MKTDQSLVVVRVGLRKMLYTIQVSLIKVVMFELFYSLFFNRRLV